MSEEIRNIDTTPETPPPAGVRRSEVIKRISWAAVFSGVLVAMAMEILFLAFGLFIGFRMGSPMGVRNWSIAWYLLTAICALFLGGWVSGRLSGNPYKGSGALHGLVTWGLTTVWTLALALWIGWGAISSTLRIANTTVMASAAAAPAITQTIPRGEANRLANQAANAVNSGVQAIQQNGAQIAANAAHQVSNVALIVFGGVLLGAIFGIVGGSTGHPKHLAAL